MADSYFSKALNVLNGIIFIFNKPLHLQALASPSGPLPLDTPQVLDSPLLPPLASPTRARSPDVISSASTAMSQDMPEIASQTMQHQRGLVPSLEPLPLSALQTDSMASAASALHLLTSPRTASNNGCVDYRRRQGCNLTKNEKLTLHSEYRNQHNIKYCKYNMQEINFPKHQHRPRMNKATLFSVSACCPLNSEVQTGQSQSRDSATPHLYSRTPCHRRTLLEEDPQMVA